jgi:hypothetical protein
MTANPNVRRDLLVRLAAAVWGFAIAISLLPLWLGPPYPGQLPGFARMIGFDARAPMRFALGLMLIPLLWTLALRPLLALLGRDDTRNWARNAFASASVGILWFVIIDRDLSWVLIVPAIVLGVSVALRKTDGHFSRHDLILLPVLATVYLALLDFVPRSVEQLFVIALTIVFLVRIAIVPIRRTSGLPAALCFALAPLGLALQSSFNSYDVRHSPWGPLILAIGSTVAIPCRASLRHLPAGCVRIPERHQPDRSRGDAAGRYVRGSAACRSRCGDAARRETVSRHHPRAWLRTGRAARLHRAANRAGDARPRAEGSRRRVGNHRHRPLRARRRGDGLA